MSGTGTENIVGWCGVSNDLVAVAGFFRFLFLECIMDYIMMVIYANSKSLLCKL